MIKGISNNNSNLFSLKQQPYYLYEALIAFMLLTLCFAIILPDLFFLRLSPMGGNPYTIKDPTVSWAAFMPAFREFRYEIFEHGNILWSNLRSLGMPILGNGVQGAPLFPLNLALIWLPDTLYWSVMPILRVILIGLGCYLLCRRIFGLSPTASFAFALCAGFNLNVMRWINHPWQNGLLAGIWYTYFCCALFLSAARSRKIIFWQWLGLVVSTFGMITNGFPEASALAALLAIFIFTGFIFTNLANSKNIFSKATLLIITAHLVGLSLASVQIFALLEFIQVGGALDLREGFIGRTYKSEDAIPYALSQFSYFGITAESKKYLSFSVGLFGTFFLVRGLCLWLTTSNRPWLGVACLLMMGLFISKSFGLIGFIETIFANTPVLAQSHFPLYFSPLFYFGAAYFVALGIESYITSLNATIKQKVINIFISICAGLVVLGLVLANLNEFSERGWKTIVISILDDDLQHLRFFIIASACLLAYQLFNLFYQSKINSLQIRSIFTPAICILLLTCFVSEMTMNYFKGHTKLDHWSLNLSNDLSPTFDLAVNNAPVPRHELRSNDRNGDYVEHGISLVDNGVSAILPYDQRQIRDGIFKTQYRGYWPIDGAKRNWSWESLSTNFILVKTTPKSKQTWSHSSLDENINLTNQTPERETITPRVQPLHLSGIVQGDFPVPANIGISIRFQSHNNNFWIDANIAKRQHLSLKDGRLSAKLSWRVYIPNEWLSSDRYSLTVRAIEKNSDTYDDSLNTTLRLDSPATGVVNSNNYPNLIDAPLLAATPDKSMHIFYNSNALPRAYVASSCLSDVDQNSNLDFLLKSNNVLKGQVTLKDNGDRLGVNCESYNAEFKRIPIEYDHGSELELESVTGPALITVNNYHYPGWKAVDQISGESLNIAKSNSIFRAVYLPEKREYKIKMNYKPWWLTVVYVLLILALILTSVVYWCLGKSHKKCSH